MNSAGKPRQPGLTRRKLAAGFFAIAALVSSVALVAQPEPPPEPAARAPIDLTIPDAEAPDESPGDTEARVLEDIRVTIDCTVQRRCTIDSGGGRDLVICRDSCDGGTHTVTPGSTNEFGVELPVTSGFRRVDPTTREIALVLPSGTVATDYVRVQPASDGELILEGVGNADMDVTAEYDEAPTASVPTSDDTTSVLVVLFAGALILAAAGVGLFAVYALILAILNASAPSARSVEDGDEDEGDKTEKDLPVDAPLALAQPVTKAVAEERAEVARDLLDRVREIDDPRLSIQTGFSLLETGFGRVHLARRRNETSTAYVARVFGDHEDLRPTMSNISQLFELARFSDMPVDSEMRSSMIDGLAKVKDTWEQEAFLLSELIPAPPSMSTVGSPLLGDQPEASDHKSFEGDGS